MPKRVTKQELQSQLEIAVTENNAIYVEVVGLKTEVRKNKDLLSASQQLATIKGSCIEEANLSIKQRLEVSLKTALIPKGRYNAEGNWIDEDIDSEEIRFLRYLSNVLNGTDIIIMPKP